MACTARYGLCILGFLCASAEAYTFFVKPSARMCFTEELGDERLLMHITYQTSRDISIVVARPNGEPLLTQTLTEKKGSLQVPTSGKEGPHAICLFSSAQVPISVSLSIETHRAGIGEYKEYQDPASQRTFYHNPTTKESLWTLPKEVTTLLRAKDVDSSVLTEDVGSVREEISVYANYMNSLEALLDQIVEESAGISERQNHFVHAAEATSRAVFWMSIVQATICFILPLIQTVQMQRLFLRKKMV
ncbi:hypothetical protein DIPPA_32087 [Diplonema papillatum]|nr:hypothetical protein DIPPA_32087 [Diplonema papillatum]